MKNHSDTILLKNIISLFSTIATFSRIANKEFIIFRINVPLIICAAIFSLKSYFHIIILLEVGNVFTICFIGGVGGIFSYTMLCLKEFYCNSNLWKDLFNRIDIFDLKMESLHVNFDIAVATYYLKFIISNMIYIIMYVLIYFEGNLNFTTSVVCTYTYFMSIQVMTTTYVVVIRCFFLILQKRYKTLEWKVKDTYISLKVDNKTFWNGHQLKSSYLLLYEVINYFNRLFEQRIFLIIAITFFNIIAFFNIFLGNNLITSKFVWAQSFQVVYFTVSIFFLST